MKFITIGLVQTKVSDNVAANIEKTIKLIGQAAKKGAKIVALQELFQTPYFPQWEHKNKDDYAENILGSTIGMMRETAIKFGVAIIVPFYEKIKDKYFNTAVVIDKKGRLLGQYHKMHIPHDPGFYEKEYFEHGDLGYKIFTIDGVKFATLICYDQWFPEAARVAKLAGAEIIFYPTAIGNILGSNTPEGDWHDAWETVQRGHAIANNIYIAAINRVGREGQTLFFGQSFISDPFGKIIKRGSKNKEEIILAKLDLSRNKLYEEGWGFIHNRRPDTYRKILGK
jgi:agmatine deiminase